MSPVSQNVLQPERFSMGSLLSKNPSGRDEQSCASPYFKSDHTKGMGNFRLRKLKTNLLVKVVNQNATTSLK